MSASSQSSQARSEAPSAQRAAEARAHGHVPRAYLAGPAAALLVTALSFSSISEQVALALRTWLRTTFQAIAQGDMPGLADTSLALLGSCGALLATLLAGCFAAMCLASALSQGGFVFSLRALSPRRSFDKIASTRSVTGALAALATFVAIAASLHSALRLEVRELTPWLATLTLRLAAVWLLLALVDASLARAAWWRSLWMTRHQRKAEEREAYGSPESRAARDRLRRETSRAQGHP